MRLYFVLVLFVVALLTACSTEPAAEPAKVVEPAKGAVPAPAPGASETAEESLLASGRAESPEGNGESSEPSAEQQDEAQSLAQDQRYRQLVLGTWEDDYEGHRTMTLNEDGSGTMIVELSGMKATLFAARLEFNMQWTLQGGRLQKRTIDGTPARRVNMILKMMGDRVDEPILELTDDRLLLLDKDGVTQYDWRRKEGSSAPSE